MEEFIYQSLKKTFNEILDFPIEEKILLEASSKFKVYIDELIKWNRAYSLTSIEEPKEIVTKHFMDSLLFLCFTPKEDFSLADIGSGAGFPAVPIAIVRPALKITLIEPSWKKTAFLKNIRRKLDLKNVEIIQNRAEEVEEKFNIVVSRALWSANELIRRTSHLLEEGGYYILSKSRKLEEELRELKKNVKFEIREFNLIAPEASPESIKRAIIKICVS